MPDTTAVRVPRNIDDTTDCEHSVLNAQNADRRGAVSELWDCETRSEMEAPELRRFSVARKLFRAGVVECAREALGTPEPKYAESFNLLGVIHESLGNFDEARKCYGKARSLDKNYLAAQENGCRIYELFAFGHSAIPMYL